MEPFMFILMYIYTCISWFICKSLAFIIFPFCILLFLILNILPFRFFFPILEDFIIFLTSLRMYAQIPFKFAYILITHKCYSLLANIILHIKDWSVSALLRLATMLALLILLVVIFTKPRAHLASVTGIWVVCLQITFEKNSPSNFSLCQQLWYCSSRWNSSYLKNW